MLTKTLTPALNQREDSINILNKDNLWIGDSEAFTEEIEEMEETLGYKLNRKKALWVYTQLHQLERDLNLVTVKNRLQKIIQIAIKQMATEKNEERRIEIENIIYSNQCLYDWFETFSELNVLSNLPRIF